MIKMVIAPVIFCTVVTGIAGMESMKAVGHCRGGGVALFRSGQHHRADYRSDYRQRGAAGPAPG
ncbi:hypothetical protein MJ390_28355 [Klebsiella pneumoniae]|nr:hypothetical protein MJ390_28355 [Klebsiella pneumoniae]